MSTERRGSRAQQIVDLATSHPGISIKDAAEQLGLAKSSLTVMVSNLRKEGRLASNRGVLVPAVSIGTSPSSAGGKKGSSGKADELLATSIFGAKQIAEKIGDENQFLVVSCINGNSLAPLVLAGDDKTVENVFVTKVCQGLYLRERASGASAVWTSKDQSGKRLIHAAAIETENNEISVSFQSHWLHMESGQTEKADDEQARRLADEFVRAAGTLAADELRLSPISDDDEVPSHLYPMVAKIALDELEEVRAKGSEAQIIRGLTEETELVRLELPVPADSYDEARLRYWTVPMILAKTSLTIFAITFDAESELDERTMPAVLAIGRTRSGVIIQRNGGNDGNDETVNGVISGAQGYIYAEIMHEATTRSGVSNESSELTDQPEELQGLTEQVSSINELIAQGCAIAERERRNQSASYSALVAAEDGEVLRIGLGGGGANLAVMTGVFGDQQAEMLNAIGQGNTTMAVFINMLDLQSEGQDMALISAWEGNDLAAAFVAPIGDESIGYGSPAWQSMSADDLLELGLAAAQLGSEDPSLQEDEEIISDNLGSSDPVGVMTEAQRDQVFGTVVNTVGGSADQLPADEEFLMVALCQTGMEPYIALHKQGKVNLDYVAVVESNIAAALYGLDEADYGVVGWVGRIDNEGDRMVIVVGYGPSGPGEDPNKLQPEVYTYILHRDGSIEVVQLMMVQALVTQLIKGWSLAHNESASKLEPPSDSTFELLTTIARQPMLEMVARNEGSNPEDIELITDGAGLQVHTVSRDIFQVEKLKIESSPDLPGPERGRFVWELSTALRASGALWAAWCSRPDEGGDGNATITAVNAQNEAYVIGGGDEQEYDGTTGVLPWFIAHTLSLNRAKAS